MREIKRESDNPMMTGRLVSGRPYLRQDQNTGQFCVEYWREFFVGDKWRGSGWYEEPEGKNIAMGISDWPKRSRIWALPGVRYGRPNVKLRKLIHSGKN